MTREQQTLRMGNTGNSNQKERPTVYCSHHGKSPTLDVPDYLMNFSPKLDILPEPQRAIWTELKTTPEQFVLYGGTALALRLGHPRFGRFRLPRGSEWFRPRIILRRTRAQSSSRSRHDPR